MAGWPLVPSDDLYGGGPAYPLSSLGVRVQLKPTANQAILAGVFDDNPGGGAFGDDAQALDHGGTKFNLNTGALWIAEYQYSATPFGLAGTYKIGGWYDTSTFPDQVASVRMGCRWLMPPAMVRRSIIMAITASMPWWTRRCGNRPPIRRRM